MLKDSPIKVYKCKSCGLEMTKEIGSKEKCPRCGSIHVEFKGFRERRIMKK